MPANEFLNLEGDKISTSKNWAVWLHEYLDEFPDKEDVLRYVLCANAPETKDNDFTWKDYQARNNNELVAILGNFVNRALVLTQKYYSGAVPALGELTDYDRATIEELGWSIYSTSLMQMIPGVDFVMLDSQCCGIAGTYGFKKENYPYSQKIGEPLFKQIQDLKVDLVATDCETCKWQIEMSTGVTVENPISILADALDVEATEQLNKA